MPQQAQRALPAEYDLTSDGLKVALKNLISADVPAMCWGAPGIGKSACARAVADELGYRYLDVRALLLDPVDLRGIPWRDEKNRTQWAPPIFLPDQDSTEPVLLNLEELPAAPPMVQAALYQLVFDPRQLGEYILPASARIMACGNRETDRGGVTRMLAPLASRFIHLDATLSAEEWIDWALGAKLAPQVIFFIKWQPKLLHQFDPKNKEKAFPCPRTWEFVSDAVKAGNQGSSLVDLAILRGAVGEGAAIEFASFLELYKHLPDVIMIFNDPSGVQIPEDPATLIALCGAVVSQASPDKMDSICEFARRLRPEIGEFMVNGVVKYAPDCRYETAFMHWEAYLSKL